MVCKQPILLTGENVPPPALIRAGRDALPPIIRGQGKRAASSNSLPPTSANAI
jgi:hypothetical protein